MNGRTSLIIREDITYHSGGNHLNTIVISLEESLKDYVVFNGQSEKILNIPLLNYINKLDLDIKEEFESIEKGISQISELLTKLKLNEVGIQNEKVNELLYATLCVNTKTLFNDS